MCAGETWNSWYLQSKNYTKIIIHFEDEVNIAGWMFTNVHFAFGE